MEQKANTVFFIAALISYPLAWFYVKHASPGPFLFLFALFFITGVELLSFFARRKRSKESIFWTIVLILQGLASWIYHGWHAEELGTLQFPAIHLTAVYYVLARTNVLVKQNTSGYLVLDALEGIFVLPFHNYFLRIRTLKNGLHTEKKHSALSVFLNILLILVIITIAWALLSNADNHFAAIGSGLGRWISDVFQGDWCFWLLLSLPVGSYLYGLIAGAVQNKKSTFHEISEEKRKIVSSATWQILMVLLILVYLIFFTVSFMEFLNANGTSQVLSAPSASEFAVNGFWNLIGIMALNGIVLACAQYFGKDCDLQQGRIRIFSLILMSCSLAFLFLDYIKVHVYTQLYGCTPKRIYALWTLAWLLCAILLIIMRLFRKYNCVQYLLCFCAFFFTALCLFNTEGYVIKRAVADLQAKGRKPDLYTLEICNFDTSAHVVSDTRILSEYKWFHGLSAYELHDLYLESTMQYDNNQSENFYIDLIDKDGTTGRLYVTCQNDMVINTVMK